MRILILILLFSQSLIAQQENELKVDYEYKNIHFSAISSLIVNGDRAIFWVKAFSKPTIVQKDVLNYKANGDHYSTVNIENSDDTFYVSNKKDRIVNIVRSDDYSKMRLMIKDSLPDVDWEIQKESKSILGYRCTLATGEFRGRVYEAYFTEQIPLSSGPFKFKGLPGLILEIYNIENDFKHHWKAVRVDKKGINIPLIIPDFALMKSFTLQEFLAEQEQQRLKRNRTSIARLPKGTRQTSSSYVRLGPEKIYEWELE